MAKPPPPIGGCGEGPMIDGWHLLLAVVIAALPLLAMLPHDAGDAPPRDGVEVCP